MSSQFHIVVCGSVVPDPLQTLEPVAGPQGPALKNEAMLPHVLDPWASHALYEAAHLARRIAGSKVWLVSPGPKAKLQQVMMTVAQKVPFELVALDGPSGGFANAADAAAALADAIATIPGLDPARMLVFVRRNCRDMGIEHTVVSSTTCSGRLLTGSPSAIAPSRRAATTES